MTSDVNECIDDNRDLMWYERLNVVSVTYIPTFTLADTNLSYVLTDHLTAESSVV